MERMDSTDQLRKEINDLESLLSEKRLRLKELLLKQKNPYVDKDSPPDEKIHLFRSLFKGREDVYALRFESKLTGRTGYQPDCANEWKTGICDKQKFKCADCPNRNFKQITDITIKQHLTGVSEKKNSQGLRKPFVMGLYPMLKDETCHLLAIDFDKKEWEQDIRGFLESCKEYNVPAYPEKSRSGKGAHIWIFFEEPIKAYKARKFGSSLLAVTLDKRPEAGLDSFDRFFPNQDTLPKGGFGNLIALPLQKAIRHEGKTCFMDDNLIPHSDQWTFFSAVRKIGEERIDELLQNELPMEKLFASLPEDVDSDFPLLCGKPEYPRVDHSLPAKVSITLSSQIFIDSKKLPPVIRSRILRLAAFSNPEFYKAQKMRLPTWNKPRILYCYEQHGSHIALPVGCLDDLLDLFKHYGINLKIRDQRIPGEAIDTPFRGQLYPDQKKSAEALLNYETGVLSATTAFGKTVVALWIIAQRHTNTLILVHRKQLMEQWKERISQFMDISPKEIGQYGGGKKKRFGKIDIAVIQSVNKKGEIEPWVEEYGQIIVDECHHLSAFSFEQVVRNSPAKYKLGLSATVIRKDGQHPIIFMNLGPVRYKVNAKKESQKRAFLHKVNSRYTDFEVIPTSNELSIQEIFKFLWQNEDRNSQIVKDIIEAVQDKKEILIISERTDHLDLLYSLLEPDVKNLYILKGRMGKKQIAKAMEELNKPVGNESRIVLATGKYLGEGIDLPFLDTLFLTFPISWKGTVAQYAGRLHRDYRGKKEVVIYDYHDAKVPVLSRMYEKRVKGYKTLGYEIC